MNQLIKIESKTIGNEKVNAVNARELHEFLEVGKDFSNWIKGRIEQYEFIENTDYEVIASFGENPSGGRPKQEYIISIDMAKELSMVERNEKGKEARKYFIECEKKLKEGAKPMTAMQILETQLAIMKEHELKLLEIQNKQIETDNKLNLIEAKISTSNSDYYSVSGYASLKGFRHLDIRKANLIGRLAAKLSKEYGVDIGKVKDERYGNVNIYHIDILHEAFTRKI